MVVPMRNGLVPLALLVTLAGCGSAAHPASIPTAPSSTGLPTATPTATSTAVRRVPDADSIAQILLAIPVAKRPDFLDPYGAAIHGSQLGLGPSLRIAGYRADPLFVCVQHVDMVAGTAGAWTAYAATGHGVARSAGSRGQCPPAPGRPRVLE